MERDIQTGRETKIVLAAGGSLLKWTQQLALYQAKGRDQFSPALTSLLVVDRL